MSNCEKEKYCVWHEVVINGVKIWKSGNMGLYKKPKKNQKCISCGRVIVIVKGE